MSEGMSHIEANIDAIGGVLRAQNQAEDAAVIEKLEDTEDYQALLASGYTPDFIALASRIGAGRAKDMQEAYGKDSMESLDTFVGRGVQSVFNKIEKDSGAPVYPQVAEPFARVLRAMIAEQLAPGPYTPPAEPKQ